MRSKKHKKLKKLNLFMAINIFLIICCIVFYGARLIHFYRIENPRQRAKPSLISLVMRNVVATGDGLYEEENGHTYKGAHVDNFVNFSGRRWRIISIDEDNNIKMITDRPQTSLVFGIQDNFETSYARSWLNDEDNEIKSFYQSLSDTDILVDTKTCIDVVTPTNISCAEYVTDRIGLLSVYEYNQAGGETSFLNISEYWWVSNVDETSTAWFINPDGNVNNNSFQGNTFFPFGLRPTITIKGEVVVLSGEGTSESPFSISESTSRILNQKFVGEYVDFSDYTWRIIETDKEFVKIVMDGFVQNEYGDVTARFGQSNMFSVTAGIGHYLNNAFYNSLSDTHYILSKPFLNGRYSRTYQYDFNKIAEFTEIAKVGLLQLGELFITEYSNYYLASRTITTEGLVYHVLDKGRIIAGSTQQSLYIRPVIHLRPDLIIKSGHGTRARPYQVGE